MLRTAKKGFTLIELLIVVVIIGILAAIAIPKFANTKQKAYVAAMKSDLRNLVTAQEAYFSNAQTYSTTANLVSSSSFRPSANVTLTDIGSPTATGWGAQASHSGVPGQTCWIQIGSGTTTEGTPNC